MFKNESTNNTASNNQTSEYIREDSLKHTNAMLLLLVERIERLNELSQLEQLKPMQRETLLVKYLGIFAKLLKTRQQYVVETDQTSDLLKRFLFWGLDKQE